MVPKKTKISVWAAYRPGQEIDKNPSAWYVAMQQLAVGQVAEKEGFIDEAQVAFTNSLKFATLAKERGEIS